MTRRVARFTTQFTTLQSHLRRGSHTPQCSHSSPCVCLFFLLFVLLVASKELGQSLSVVWSNGCLIQRL